MRLKNLKWFIAPALMSAVFSVASLPAATAPNTPEAERDERALNTGSVPGMPAETMFRASDGGRMYRNISRATITPVLPRPDAANGAAVLILPGGAFAFLSMDNEGWSVARWFADHGVAAFVVKYRLNPTSVRQSDFDAQMTAEYRKILAGGRMPELPVPAAAVADGRAALKFVRDRSRQYGIDPARVGMVGFSAGAMTTLSVVESASPQEQPAFIVPIYPPMTAVAVPASAPPMFVAIAADDPLFGKQGFGLIQAWQAAGKPVELHFYQKGGHGFGMADAGITTSDWKAAALHWMAMNGFTTRSGANSAPR